MHRTSKISPIGLSNHSLASFSLVYYNFFESCIEITTVKHDFLYFITYILRLHRYECKIFPDLRAMVKSHHLVFFIFILYELINIL